MTAYPSDLVYQANTARRQELLLDAAIERRAGQLGRARSRGMTIVGHARRNIGRVVVALGRRLQGVDDVATKTPAVES